AFRQDLEALLGEDPTRIAMPMPRRGEAASIVIDEARTLPIRRAEHPFFAAELPLSRDPATFARQAAADLEIMTRFEARLWEARVAGKGKLTGAKSFTAFAGQDPFVDGFTCVFPARPGVEYELLVLGDLHGCYSCLKAALLQADFLGKVEAYRA